MGIVQIMLLVQAGDPAHASVIDNFMIGADDAASVAAFGDRFRRKFYNALE